MKLFPLSLPMLLALAACNGTTPTPTSPTQSQLAGVPAGVWTYKAPSGLSLELVVPPLDHPSELRGYLWTPDGTPQKGELSGGAEGDQVRFVLRVPKGEAGLLEVHLMGRLSSDGSQLLEHSFEVQGTPLTAIPKQVSSATGTFETSPEPLSALNACTLGRFQTGLQGRQIQVDITSQPKFTRGVVWSITGTPFRNAWDDQLEYTGEWKLTAGDKLWGGVDRGYAQMYLHRLYEGWVDLRLRKSKSDLLNITHVADLSFRGVKGSISQPETLVFPTQVPLDPLTSRLYTRKWLYAAESDRITFSPTCT